MNRRGRLCTWKGDAVMLDYPAALEKSEQLVKWIYQLTEFERAIVPRKPAIRGLPPLNLR